MRLCRLRKEINQLERIKSVLNLIWSMCHHVSRHKNTHRNIQEIIKMLRMPVLRKTSSVSYPAASCYVSGTCAHSTAEETYLNAESTSLISQQCQLIYLTWEEMSYERDYVALNAREVSELLSNLQSLRRDYYQPVYLLNLSSIHIINVQRLHSEWELIYAKLFSNVCKIDRLSRLWRENISCFVSRL